MPTIACSYSKLVPIDQLKPYSKNRNKHPQDQIERLARLMEFHGIRHPVIVSTLSGEVIAGNGRLEALKLLGAKEVPVDFQSFEDAEAEYTFSVSDNAIADWAELDLAGINADLPHLGPFDIDMLGIEHFKVDLDMPEIEEPEPENPHEIECPNCGERFHGKASR